MLHKWWSYMIFTVCCRTFMNHCNLDSSTKTHISSHTNHVFFNDSSLQKFTYPLTQNMPSFTKVHMSSHHAPQMLRNIWNLLRKTFPWTKKPNKQKTKESQPWWGLGLFFFAFGFLLFWFFWSTKWPCRKCMSLI